MPFKQTHRPDQIVRKAGGGCLALFGLPFLLAGVAIVLASLGLLGKAEGPPWFVGVPFGAVFAAVGLGLMTGRRAILIDGGEGKVVVTTSVFGVRWTKERSTESMDCVAISKEIRRSDKSTYTVYPVRLEGGGERIDIEEPRDTAKARIAAEQVAKVLKLNLRDRSTGQEIVREHDKLDESIRDRAKRLGEVVEVPEMPGGTRVEFRIEGRELTLHYSPSVLPGGLGLRLGCGIVAAAVPIAIIVAVMADRDLPTELRYIVGAVLGVFLLAGFLAFLGSTLGNARRRVFINASLDHLRVEQRGLFKTRTTEIPADEIEELVLPAEKGVPNQAVANMPKFLQSFVLSLASAKAGGIVARSDNATVEFGKELSPEEKAWVYAIVKRMLTA